jgi:hypothetical protein
LLLKQTKTISEAKIRLPASLKNLFKNEIKRVSDHMQTKRKIKNYFGSIFAWSYTKKTKIENKLGAGGP